MVPSLNPAWTVLIKKNGPIKIRIAGIDCMTPNLKKVNVLYANAQMINETEELNLQKLANNLAAHFYNRGLVQRYQENVRLHMTLINTKDRNSHNSPNKKWRETKQSFDATSIVQKYKHFHFGECDLDSINLSMMDSVGDDGFYTPIAMISTE